MAWTLKAFRRPGGPSIVKSWYEIQDEDVQAAFDTRLKFLASQPVSGWVRPYSGKLEGECDGLVEIRFQVRKVQYRPLGFFGHGGMEFTIVFFATERDNKFEPLDACALARKLVAEIVRNRELTCEFSIE